MVRAFTTSDFRSALRIALIFAMGSALVGCKKSASSSNSQLVCTDTDRGPYIRQSAEWRPEEGEAVETTFTGKTIVDGYFGKKYNANWLTAVGRASILDTINYIETTGARVYRSDPISKKSSMNLESATVMPWDLDRVWRDADQPIAGTSCAFMAGLYLGEKTRGLQSLKTRAAIIVREDAGRWTLVHEFMHHNFKTQAAENGYEDEKARNLQGKLFKQISDLKADRTINNRDYASRLSALFQQLIDVVDQTVIQYQFEEVTVEATLQDKYRVGELAYVPSGAYSNASWYIAHSKTNIQKLYDSLTATYNELALLTATNGLFQELRALDRYVAMRDLRLGQLDAFIAKRKPDSENLGFVTSTEIVPTEGYAPCVHAEAMEAQMNAIAEAMRAPRGN
jgi:hypothetical protein